MKESAQDEVRVFYPGYIGNFPVNFQNDPNYMGSPNIVEFARQQGWWDPQRDNPNYINLHDVYSKPFQGLGVSKAENHFRAMRIPPERERELETMVPISLEDMLALVRDPRWSNDRAGYGHVAHLRPNVPTELQTLWTAVTAAVTTPYVPISIATSYQAVPPEFVQHRYLTSESPSTYLSSNFAAQEATRYDTREFKRLLYFVSDHPVYFLPYVTGCIERYEMKLMEEHKQLEENIMALFQSNRAREAQAFVDQNVQRWLIESLHLGMQLTNIVEQQTKQLFGIRMPTDTAPPGETTPPWSQSMVARSDEEMVTAYDPKLDIYPRPFGIYSLY